MEEIRYFVAKVEQDTAWDVLVRYIVSIDLWSMEEETATVRLPKDIVEVYANLNDCVAYKVPAWFCEEHGLVTSTKAIVDEILAKM